MHSKSYYIRPVTIPDIPHLAQLWMERMVIWGQMDKRFLPDEQSLSRWSDLAHIWITSSRYCFVLSEQAGSIGGYILGRIDDDGWVTHAKTGHILQLVLDAHVYHSGLARSLVQYMLDWFSKQDIDHILVYVPSLSPVEQAFWRALKAKKMIEIWRLK